MKRGAWRGDAKKRRFVFVFTVFGGHHPFYKKQKQQKHVVKMGDVFREACRHHFFIDFCRFWTPFWEGFGHQNRKKQVSERFEKTIKKKSCKSLQKSRGCPPQTAGRGGGAPYKYPPRRPTHPLRSICDPCSTHYDHTTACLRGTVADLSHKIQLCCI